MSLQVDIGVDAPAWRQIANLEHLVEAAIRAVLRDEGLEDARDCEVSVLLCDDAKIRDLNKLWRGIDQPTNVLSFPADDVAEEFSLFGDLAIAFETTAREAQEEGKTLEAHLSHLVVHGFLHLLGHDHEEDEEAEEMEAAERRILSALGLEDPYAGSEPA